MATGKGGGAPKLLDVALPCVHSATMTLPPDLPLSSGLFLAETLATETTLTPDQAVQVVLAYRQFLALQHADPSLLPPQLIGLAAWRHRRDDAAWQAFCTAWPPAGSLPPLPHHPPTPRETIPTVRALRASGVTPDPALWPQPWRVALAALCLPLMVAGFLLTLCSGLLPSWYQALALLIGLPLLILPRLLAAKLLPVRAQARPALTSNWLDTARF